MKMTVADLIAALESMPEDAEVRLAFQPSYPLEYGVANVGLYEDDDETSPGPREIVYIGEGGQHGYLSRDAAEVVWG